MRFSLITIASLFCGLSGFCQAELFFPLNNEFDWVSIERKNPELKREFIEDLPDELAFYRQNNLSYLEDCLHIADFNGDGLDDVLFNGFIASEREYLIVFINTGTRFAAIFTGHQKITKVILKDGKVDQLYIKDSGCCCEYIGVNRVYNVDHSATMPEITLISQMQYLNNGVEKYPDHYFHKAIQFEVLNDRYNIRFSPVVDDATEVGYCGELHKGNSLGKIKSGSVGYALSETVDSTGRIWWFVALHPESEISESIYYDQTTLPDSYKLGWISSRFVREIE